MPAQIDRDYSRISSKKVFHRYLAFAFFEGRPVTSRARWLNHITFGLYALLNWLPLLKKSQSPIFIVGVGRSGTTILGKTLSLHPSLGFLNEPKALWYKVHSDDDVIGNYGRHQGKFIMTEKDYTKEKALKARKFHGAYLRFTGSKRVVDKYPEIIFRAGFILSIFPNAKFIFLVRNGIDTCHSISEWNKRNAGEESNWWGKNNRKWEFLKSQLLVSDPELAPFANSALNDQERAALEWLITTQKGLELCRKHPESVLMVKYEGFITSPKKTITEALSFCDLESAQHIEAYMEKALTRHGRLKKVSVDINEKLMELIDKQNRLLGL